MKIVILFLIGVLIMGCEDKTSVEWYMKNHKEMISKYTECLVNKNFTPIDCQNSRSAMHREHEKPDVIEGLRAARKKSMEENIGAKP
jgi:hypothetical protein